MWPSTGLWSSKVNEFLKPRRHVLIEPGTKYYGEYLNSLVKSGRGFELLSLDPYDLNDWSDIFAKHLPEQGPSNTREAQVLPKNDTLLVLANIPEQRNIRDHYTPGRWWSTMMQSCLDQRGVHMYGSVRILVSIPGNAKCNILPRTVIDRRRTAMLTETVSQHTFEVASTYENEQWVGLKEWEPLNLNRERAAERAATHNIITPAGREIPPLESAPASPRPGKLTQEHALRPAVDWHKSVMDRIAAGENDPKKGSAAKKDGQAAIYALNLDNKQAWWRQLAANTRLEADEANRSLSRLAADPRKDSEELERADKRYAGIKATFDKILGKIHYRVVRGHDRVTDDGRIAADTGGTFDDSVFIFDRRPFEALRIDPEEQYPRVPRTFVYFEADANPPVVQKLSLLSHEKRGELMELFDTLSSVFSTRVQLSLSELYEIISPKRTPNEIVKDLPVLARYATKRLKPGSGPVALENSTLDPNDCFQENIDYDLSDTRIRRLPVSVIWDILLNYQNNAADVSPRQFSRLLGGTVTGAVAGAGSAQEFKLR